MRKAGLLWCVFFGIAVFSSCAPAGLDAEKGTDAVADGGVSKESERASNASMKTGLRVMNWNLQTFFDGVCDGNEYEQFRGSKSSWSADKYEVRLERLVEVIRSVDPDILVVEELEKEAQLYDIANRLTGTFNYGKLYPYAVFAKSEGSSIGCAVLSRRRLLSSTVHSLDIRSDQNQPSMRPLLETVIEGEDGALLHLFVNHWKSKLGEGSEKWRAYQEGVLARRMEAVVKEGGAVLACGDFNADIGEFESLNGVERAGVYEANLSLKNGWKRLNVYSPWIGDDGQVLEGGSFWYEGAWEKIDHFFAAGRVKILDFRAETRGRWADGEGRPRKYKIWEGTGYSDHLPVSAEVKF